MKNVLVLGAGLVSRPLINYLLDKGYKVKVASRTVSKAEALVAGHAHGSAEALNVNDEAHLERLVAECDVAVSLLPYTYHVKVGKLCIKHKNHLVTTSYVSEPMQALDESFKEAGIISLNEIGLDPGIDHMSAVKIMRDVEKKGGKIISFMSYCGGLPALQDNNNPYGYKFSWSPRGVVMAGKNNGQYLQDGKTIFVPGRNLFKQYTIINIEGVGAYEAYTNRNALPYKEIYGLQDATTVFRGTLRNVGWCYTMDKLGKLGLFDDSFREDLNGLTYKDMTLKLIGARNDYDVIGDTAKFLNIEPYSSTMKRLEWLGLFSDEPLPKEDNVMDMFCNLLTKQLAMAEDDLDLIILYHQFIADYGDRKEYITSTLAEIGTPNGDSIMSRTVSLPAAIGIDLLLQEKISLTGVQIPIHAEIYKPILEELEKMNIRFIDKVKTI
ncbi:MAG: saccharopine dehydrogenase [Anaerolineaceae bacterium 4572_78]|nr:MAG: saccharopine dehydrogenase [Anaerolineaceae bacterium 4572_78]